MIDFILYIPDSAIYQKSYTRREDLSLLALGEIVCAQFSKDESWYRARVVDVDAEANTVQVRRRYPLGIG